MGETFDTTQQMPSQQNGPVQQDDLSAGRLVAASDKAVVSTAQAKDEETQRRMADDKNVERGTDSVD